MNKTTKILLVYMAVQALQTMATSMTRTMDWYDIMMMFISVGIACGTTAHAFLNQNSDMGEMPKSLSSVPGIKEMLPVVIGLLVVLSLTGCASIPGWATGKAAMVGYGALAASAAPSAIDSVKAVNSKLAEKFTAKDELDAVRKGLMTSYAEDFGKQIVNKEAIVLPENAVVLEYKHYDYDLNELTRGSFGRIVYEVKATDFIPTDPGYSSRPPLTVAQPPTNTPTATEERGAVNEAEDFIESMTGMSGALDEVNP